MQIQKYQSVHWTWTFAIILGLVMVALASREADSSGILDLLASGLFTSGGMMIVVGLVYTLPGTNALEIAEEGFSYRAGWRKVFCRWEQCSEFSPVKKTRFGVVANELVTFDSDNPAVQSKSVAKTTGRNAALPDTFGLSAQDLAKNMNHFRQMQLNRLQKPSQTFL